MPTTCSPSCPSATPSERSSARRSASRSTRWSQPSTSARPWLDRPARPSRAQILAYAIISGYSCCTCKYIDSRKEIADDQGRRSEEHTSELQSLAYLVCRLLLEKK